MCDKTVIVDGVEYNLVPVSTPINRIIEASGHTKKWLDGYRITSEDEALKAVTQDGYTLKYVDAIHQTEAVCMAAVTQNGDALKYVDAIHQTEAVCMAAVTQDGYTLKYVDATQLTGGS